MSAQLIQVEVLHMTDQVLWLNLEEESSSVIITSSIGPGGVVQQLGMLLSIVEESRMRMGFADILTSNLTCDAPDTVRSRPFTNPSSVSSTVSAYTLFRGNSILSGNQSY